MFYFRGAWQVIRVSYRSLFWLLSGLWKGTSLQMPTLLRKWILSPGPLCHLCTSVLSLDSRLVITTVEEHSHWCNYTVMPRHYWQCRQVEPHKKGVNASSECVKRPPETWGQSSLAYHSPPSPVSVWPLIATPSASLCLQCADTALFYAELILL